jgi:hypothetical protein
MRRLVLGMGLVAAIGLTGCGGGGSDNKAAPTTVATSPATTVVVTGNDQAATPFCQLARTYTEKFAALLPAASANDAAKLKAVTTDAEAAIRQAKATAPAEIKADVTVVATTASDALTALQKNNFDLSKTPEAVTKLQDPAFQASFTKLNNYARAHCGLA